MKTQLVYLIAADRNNGIIGADKVAHPATHTRMFRIGALPNTMVNLENVTRFFLQAYGNVNEPLPVNSKIYGLHRAYSATPATEGTFIFVPQYPPGQIMDTQCRWLNGCN